VGGSGDPVAVKRMEPTISTRVRAGLSLGLVDLAISSDASDVQDTALAEDLARALSNHARPPRPVIVHVARNVVHPGFGRDPVAPFLIARAAHGLVARFLAEHPPARTLGIAAGLHLAAFVRSIGPDSSPFPDGDDRTFVIVPLTLEPFHGRRFELADALAGDLHARARPCLARCVCGPRASSRSATSRATTSASSTPSRSRWSGRSITGSTSRSSGAATPATTAGSNGRRKILRPRFVSPPPTDMIDENGDPIPLGEHGVRREYLGAGIDEIKSVATREGKLALLLASGESKGKPIALVVSAGCANAVVCDQAAARAVLAELEAGPSRRRGSEDGEAIDRCALLRGRSQAVKYLTSLARRRSSVG
jgi:hypothetical protein